MHHGRDPAIAPADLSDPRTGEYREEGGDVGRMARVVRSRSALGLVEHRSESGPIPFPDQLHQHSIGRAPSKVLALGLAQLAAELGLDGGVVSRIEGAPRH